MSNKLFSRPEVASQQNNPRPSSEPWNSLETGEQFDGQNADRNLLDAFDRPKSAPPSQLLPELIVQSNLNLEFLENFLNTQSNNLLDIINQTVFNLNQFYNFSNSNNANTQETIEPSQDRAPMWTPQAILGTLPSLLPPPPGQSFNMFASISPSDSCPHHHQCLRCGACYNSRRLLKAHISSHQNRKYVCGVSGCEWWFNERTQLYYHQATVHNIAPAYRCTLCDKGFGYLSAFARHIDQHSIAHSLICPHCGKKYLRAKCLRNHILTHTPPQSY